MPDRSSQEAAQKTACASCGGGLRICDGRGCRCSVCGAPWLLADVAPPNASQEAATRVLSELLERARQYLAWVDEPQFEPCQRCQGKGYHHGFGENGADPDWCESCGGPGEQTTEPGTWSPDDLLREIVAVLATPPASPSDHRGYNVAQMEGRECPGCGASDGYCLCPKPHGRLCKAFGAGTNSTGRAMDCDCTPPASPAEPEQPATKVLSRLRDRIQAHESYCQFNKPNCDGTDGCRDIELMREAAAVLATPRAPSFKCKARASADPPQDCDWPFCGCDSYAEKVITALEESGKLVATPPASPAEPKGCINCGEANDGGYMGGKGVDEGSIGPFCSQCWELVLNESRPCSDFIRDHEDGRPLAERTTTPPKTGGFRC